MSIDGALLAGRAAAERRMTSRCTIRRRAIDAQGRPMRGSDASGYDTDTYTGVATDVPCRVAGMGRATRGNARRSITVGEVVVEVAERVLHLPASITNLHDGDLVHVTAGAAAGRFFRIVETTPADQQTAMRVQCLEVQTPEDWT